MRVLHVITSLDQGGAEGVLCRLVGATPECTHRVVSLMDGGVHGAQLAAAGCDVVALGMTRGRPDCGSLWRLVREMRRFRPDVVQTWLYHADLLGGIAARVAGIRRVVWNLRSAELDPERMTRSTVWVVRVLAALSGRVPQRIVCCARRAAEVHAVWGYVTDRFVLIPNGLDLAVFRPDSAARQSLRNELGVDAATPLVGMVARWDPQKDHAGFLDAAERVALAFPGVRFVLAGRGLDHDNPALDALLERHPGVGQRLVLLGSRPDIGRVMNGLDLHVLGSAFGEAFPNVVGEAMACGTPCVVTDVGDAACIVGDTGWAVPPGAPEQLAGAIVTALSEPEALRAVRAQRARRRMVDEYGLDAMARGYRALWREVAE